VNTVVPLYLKLTRDELSNLLFISLTFNSVRGGEGKEDEEKKQKEMEGGGDTGAPERFPSEVSRGRARCLLNYISNQVNSFVEHNVFYTG
jgi:hypothetical protein